MKAHWPSLRWMAGGSTGALSVSRSGCHPGLNNGKRSTSAKASVFAKASAVALRAMADESTDKSADKEACPYHLGEIGVGGARAWFTAGRANMARSARDDLRWISQNPCCTARDGLALTGRQLATPSFVKIITKSFFLSSKFRDSKLAGRAEPIGRMGRGGAEGGSQVAK